MTEAGPGDTRCGFVAVIGAPNAGKSTLVNTMVGSKVSIVSRKVQTTRVPVRAILVEGACQLVFMDTPGIFAPRRRLDRAMVEAAWAGVNDADIVILVIDAAKGGEDTERIFGKLRAVPSPLVLALNKVDRLAKEPLLALSRALNEEAQFAATFMISALNGDGVADLKGYLLRAAPPGPWHYPEEDVSDTPQRVMAAEITREKIYQWLHDELPYMATVETTSWREQGNGVRIEQTIYVERESQKIIMLGKGGMQIRKLSMAARKELASMLQKPVHLFLFVKVRAGWGDDPERYRDLLLTFPKD